MTKQEEIEAFGQAMKTIDVKTAGNLQLLEMYELWSFELSEGYTLERSEVEFYYYSCRLELLRRMKKN